MRYTKAGSLVAAALFFCLVSTAANADPIPGLFSTKDFPVSGNKNDENYLIIAEGDGMGGTVILAEPRQAKTTVTLFGTTEGNWIGDDILLDAILGPRPHGQWDFVTTFELTGFDPSTAVINMRVGAGNNAFVTLNNGPILDPLIFGFQDLTDLTVTEGFIPGINTFRFSVISGDFPALNVVIVSSSVSPAPAVPALTGWAVGALAGLLLAIGVALKRA